MISLLRNIGYVIGILFLVSIIVSTAMVGLGVVSYGLSSKHNTPLDPVVIMASWFFIVLLFTAVLSGFAIITMVAYEIWDKTHKKL